jgi:hypothetical protein
MVQPAGSMARGVVRMVGAARETPCYPRAAAR